MNQPLKAVKGSAEERSRLAVKERTGNNIQSREFMVKETSAKEPSVKEPSYK